MSRPWISGYCSGSNPPESHARCDIYLAKYPTSNGRQCSCMCHWEPDEKVDTRGQLIGDAEVVKVEYLSDEWYAARRVGVAASEIAAILGLSPWVSAFDLWWAKKTGVESQSENRAMRRGRRYEALVLEDFADEHPEFTVAPSLTLRNVERPWQVATPDGFAYEAGYAYADPDDDSLPVAVVEAKTGRRDQWGEPGTDEIPVYYRCQVLWQMDTIGVTSAFVPVVFGDQYAEYVVEYDPVDVAVMRDAAQAFLASLETDEPPPIDSTKATLRRLKQLHPTVVEGDVEVSPAVVAQYRAARRLKDAAEDRMRLAESRLRGELGPHAVGVVDGRKVCSRSVYDVAARTQEVRAYSVNKLTVTNERKKK